MQGESVREGGGVMQRGGDTATVLWSRSLHMSFTLALWAEGHAVCMYEALRVPASQTGFRIWPEEL